MDRSRTLTLSLTERLSLDSLSPRQWPQQLQKQTKNKSLKWENPPQPGYISTVAKLHKRIQQQQRTINRLQRNLALHPAQDHTATSLRDIAERLDSLGGIWRYWGIIIFSTGCVFLLLLFIIRNQAKNYQHLKTRMSHEVAAVTSTGAMTTQPIIGDDEDTWLNATRQQPGSGNEVPNQQPSVDAPAILSPAPDAADNHTVIDRFIGPSDGHITRAATSIHADKKAALTPGEFEDHGKQPPLVSHGRSKKIFRKKLRNLDLNLLLHEVEIHVLYDNFEAAANILRRLVIGSQAKLEGNTPWSMRPWTMLFDVYRMQNKQSAHDALAQRFRKIFNIQPPGWEPSQDVDPLEQQGLEDRFLRILDRITTLWPEPECLEYLDTLIIDDRDGARRGFNLMVAEDILFFTRCSTGPKTADDSNPDK